jgi:myosin-5
MLVPSADWFAMIRNLELQKLCSLILEKTINDHEKYQNGLTKIFFRAGMLAALESLRFERLNALVTVIQKNMRRRVAQKKYQAMRQAAIKIQTWWRVIMAKAFVEGVRKTTAAIKLQTAIRRYIQLRNFKAISASVTRVQSREHHLASFSQLCISFVLGIRGLQARQAFQETRLNFSALRLQSLFRGL